METLFRRGYSREEMTKRVARFKDLHGSDGGLPDSNMPGCERTLFNVIGFQPPKGEGDAVTSPVGGDAARAAARTSAVGGKRVRCRAEPGGGRIMHNHDTNETFIPMTGRWRCSWENEHGNVEHLDLDPLDVISFPPGAIRRFENVTPGDANQEHILMFVIGGDGPRAEFTDDSMKELATAGVWPPKTDSEGAHGKG
jgi:quercetin dioxygenase-like cupin family protein